MTSAITTWSFPELSEADRTTLEQSVVSIFVGLHGGTPKFLGTGSIIASMPGRALCLTAGHVVTDSVRELGYSDKPLAITSPGASRTFPTGRDGRGTLQALVFTLGRPPEFVPVKRALSFPAVDVAIVELVSGTLNATRNVLHLNSDLFPEGTPVVAVGAQLTKVSNSVTVSAYEQTVSVRPGWQPRTGTIRHVNVVDPYHQASSYELTFPIDYGMSGAPILLAPAVSRMMQVIGFASYDDQSTWSNINDSSVPGKGTGIALLACYLAASEADEADLRLFDLVRNSTIKDMGQWWRDKRIVSAGGTIGFEAIQSH
jgi:hypothetical protein